MTTFKLYTGNNSTIEAEVTSVDQTAGWLLAVGDNKTLHIIESEALDTFYDRMDLLTHFANGDFAKWGHDKHFPRRPVVAPEGFTMAGEATLLHSSTLKDQPIDELRYVNGDWFEYYQNRNIGKAAPARAYYHTVTRWLLAGESVALRLPAFLGNEYARTILETLNLGEGKAWAARVENRQEARAEKQAYKAVRTQVLNGQGEQFGYDQPGTKLVVKTSEGTKKNMFTVKSGTIASICSSNGTALYQLPWIPEDEINLDSWRAISDPGCVLRVQLPS